MIVKHIQYNWLVVKKIVQTWRCVFSGYSFAEALYHRKTAWVKIIIIINSLYDLKLQIAMEAQESDWVMYTHGVSAYNVLVWSLTLVTANNSLVKVSKTFYRALRTFESRVWSQIKPITRQIRFPENIDDFWFISSMIVGPRNGASQHTMCAYGRSQLVWVS